MKTPKNPIGTPGYDEGQLGAPELQGLKQLAALYEGSSVSSITVRYDLCLDESLRITALEFGFILEEPRPIRPPSCAAIGRTLEVFKDLIPAVVGVPQPPYYQEVSGSFCWELHYYDGFTHTHTLETHFKSPVSP